MPASGSNPSYACRSRFGPVIRRIDVVRTRTSLPPNAVTRRCCIERAYLLKTGKYDPRVTAYGWNTGYGVNIGLAPSKGNAVSFT